MKTQSELVKQKNLPQVGETFGMDGFHMNVDEYLWFKVVEPFCGGDDAFICEITKGKYKGIHTLVDTRTIKNCLGC